MKSDVTTRGVAARQETTQALSLMGAMAGVALPVGISATRFSQDMMVGLVAAGLAALLVVSLLQALGVLGGR